MNILGIETSCDETAIAVVENGTKILSNVVSSSKELQMKYGGVYPEMAARKQAEVIIPVLEQALRGKRKGKRNILAKNSSLSSPFTLNPLPLTIDAVAVTTGPGLIGSLLVGIECAKTLAYVLNKPIIPVNHVNAHIYANWLANDKNPQFPALCLTVSGGHTQLMLMEDHGQLRMLGETLDDASGEAFDKTARLIGLPYPGGPEIQKHAESGNPKAFNFPRGMIGSKDYNFSFSGFKTAVLREVAKINKLTPQIVSDLSASIQEAIVDVLVKKTLTAALEFKPKSVIVSGGVAANKRLEEKFIFQISNFKLKIPLFIPPPSLCTDNGAVIASFAFFNYNSQPWNKIEALA